MNTYAVEGKSGRSIVGRAALQQLIADTESGAIDSNVILVCDAICWGHFQDADEGAYYEYICKRAGINVTYCADQFENDGSPGITPSTTLSTHQFVREIHAVTSPACWKRARSA